MLGRAAARTWSALFLAAAWLSAEAAAQDGAFSAVYQEPPPAIARALEAPGTPVPFVSPDRRKLALMARPSRPSIADLAMPELGLAGQSLNPLNNGPSRTSPYSGLTLVDIASGSERSVDLPAGSRIIAPLWSPSGSHIAFLRLGEDEVELWAADAGTGRSRRLAGGVNAALPRAFEWLPDSSGLIVRLVPEGRGPAPERDPVPAGPIVQETSGAAAPVQTVQNLLRTPHDETLFEHYFTSRLAEVRLDGSPPRSFGAPGIVSGMSVSPDGRFILQQRIARPFSYRVAASSFPTEIVVTDRSGRILRRVADLPLRTGGVAAGPRNVHWRADADATLAWVEAAAVPPQAPAQAGDRLYALAAPFSGAPVLLVQSEDRISEIFWGRDNLAIMSSISLRERARRLSIIDPGLAGGTTMPARSALEDGRPLLRPTGRGGEVLHLVPGTRELFLERRGHILRKDLESGLETPLWSERRGETFLTLLDPRAEQVLLWHESREEPPNIVAMDRGRIGVRQLTNIDDPAPQLARIQRRTIHYARSDGAQLRGTLYLPDGYDPRRDGPLPVLVWSYPSVRSTTFEASQGDDDRFVRPTGFDPPVLLVTQGYALFEAAMPIIAREGVDPNDVHVPQLVANAEAAIDALVAEGVASRDRVAIGGHSFGAGMVANLLAHSDLFRTGIALSGAYNRTLTPFGFQAFERRNFWQAREAYLAMSAFVHADRINEPILLVHGTDDSNSGTTPLQTESLYAALAGLGRDARYVKLPLEDHNYQARESVGHLMWEMSNWLDRHLRERATN